MRAFARELEAAVETLLDVVTQRARALGHEHGRNAAEWASQGAWGGRVWSPLAAREAAQRFLDGYDDGDPAVVGQFRSPDLSGEWADEPTPQSVLDAVLPAGIEVDADCADELCSAYLDAAESAFWETLVREATVVAEHEQLPC